MRFNKAARFIILLLLPNCLYARAGIIISMIRLFKIIEGPSRDSIINDIDREAVIALPTFYYIERRDYRVFRIGAAIKFRTGYYIVRRSKIKRRNQSLKLRRNVMPRVRPKETW